MIYDAVGRTRNVLTEGKAIPSDWPGAHAARHGEELRHKFSSFLFGHYCRKTSICIFY